MNKIPAVLVLLSPEKLVGTLSYFNFDNVQIQAVLMPGASNGFVAFGNARVPVFTFNSIGNLLRQARTQFFWLIGNMSVPVDQLWSFAKFLIDEGVPRERIINCIPLITREWFGNLRFVEKNPIDFFATGISYTEVGLDLNRIVGARGVNLAGSNQDLRQGYLTARHVFKHQKSIKFVLIGLTPYSLRYDNRKAFSVCNRNAQYIIALDECKPETLQDKVLMHILNPQLKKSFESTTEASADPNNEQVKRASNHNLALNNLADWKKQLDNQNKKFFEDTIGENVAILENYIKLCLEHGAKPIGVIFPFAPSLRRNYPREMLFHFRQTLKQFERAYDFKVIDLFDLPLGYDCFYNMAHLNLKGAAISSALLNLRLHEQNILPFEQLTDTPLAELRSLADVLDKNEYNAVLEKIFAESAALIRRKDRIKIGFVTYDASMWSGDELYAQFDRNERYEPKVFLCLRRDQAGDPNVIKDFRHGLDQFRSRGINVVGVENDQTPIEQQDVLIFLTPYMSVLPRAFQFDRSKAKILTAYIPYSMQVSNFLNIKESIMFVAWKIFFDTLATLNIYDQKCAVGMPRGLYSGHPKLDALVSNQTPIYHWKEARPKPTQIIWAPHWSINEEGVRFATFQWNYQFMLDYAREHPEISWVVKPHPNLLFSAVKEKVFPSTEAFEAYLAQWDALPNAKVETGAYYHNIFASSDGMILDSGSFILEYQYTHKPMLFLTRDTQQFGETASELMQVTYRVDGKDHAGIANFIEKVLIGKNDPMREARRAFFDKHLNYVKDNGMLASEFIFNAIDKELRR